MAEEKINQTEALPDDADLIREMAYQDPRQITDKGFPILSRKDIGTTNQIILKPHDNGEEKVSIQNGLTIGFTLANDITGAATIKLGDLGAKPFKTKAGNDFVQNTVKEGDFVITKVVGDEFRVETIIREEDFSEISYNNIPEIKGISNKITKYIVSGDSTRDNLYNEMMFYYRGLLAGADIGFYDNSRSGQSLTDWVGNIDSPSIDEAIAEIQGDGSGTLLELSLGLNDWGIDNSKSYLVNKLREGIDYLLDAKPELTIVLVTPIPTANTERQKVYKDAYQEVAKGKGLSCLVSDPVFHGAQEEYSYVFNDGTHPNSVGARRLTNYIFNNIFPPSMLQKMAMNWVDVNSDIAITPTPLYITGKWLNPSGNESNSADAVCSTPIFVSYGSTYEIYHGGERGEVYFYDSSMNKVDGVIVYGEDDSGAENTALPKTIYINNRSVAFMRFNATLHNTYDGAGSYVKRTRHIDTGIPLIGETTAVVGDDLEANKRYLLGGSAVLNKTDSGTVELRASGSIEEGAGINMYPASHSSKAYSTKIYVQNSLGGQLLVSGLPETDPHISGALWDDGGTVKRSHG